MSDDFETMTQDDAIKMMKTDPAGYARRLLDRMKPGDEKPGSRESYAAHLRKAVLTLPIEEQIDFMVTSFIPLMLAYGESIRQSRQCQAAMEEGPQEQPTRQ